MKLIIFILIFIAGSHDFSVESICGKKIDLLEGNSRKVIVFLSGWSCSECFSKLDSVFNEVDYPLERIVLIRSPRNSIVNRKSYIEMAKNYFSEKKYSFLFDIHKENDPIGFVDYKSGMFGKYKTNYTPALLLIRNGKTKFYNFFSLFGANKKLSTDINEILDSFFLNK